MLKTIRRVILSASAFLMASALVLAQNPQTVRGKVTDPSGEPVIGASVFVKDTPNGAITDTNGAYSLPRVKSGDILVFSCIGYVSQEIAWTGGTLDVVLSEDNEMLDETVIVGYGAQKKMNLSGAVSSVKMDEVLGDRPQPNVAAALQGAIPGLYVSSSSSTPGQTGKSIQIRGTASFSGSSTNVSGISPLILIDNVPGDIDALSPDDIESVTVLKDASASAIYGARAAAGVVLITTKRPRQAEKVKINYSNNFGFVNAINTPSQVDAVTYLKMYKEAFNTNLYGAAQSQNIDSWLGYIEKYRSDPASLSSEGKLTHNGIFTADADGLRYYLTDDDQYKRMTETGFSMNHNLAVTGATDRIRFRLSANAYEENGPLFGKKDIYQRKSVNSVVSADIAKWFTQELDIYYTQQNREFLNDESGALYGVRTPNFLPDGEDPAGYTIRTPRNILENANVRYTNIAQPRIFTKSILRPVKGLDLIFEYTYQRKGTDYNYFSGKYTYTDIQLNVLNGPEHDYYNTRRSIEDRNSINAYATYAFEPWKNHHIQLMGGFNQEAWEYAYFETRAEDQAILSIPSMGNAQGKVTTGDLYQDYALRSGFFRLNYDYDGRYILEASGRYDGSSKFPKNARFGFFPSFSLAWNITREPFMQGTKGWLNLLKPRFSYGSIGNQSSVGYYDYISSLAMNTQGKTWLSGNDNGYVTVIGAPGIISNNFTWETIYTTNVGLDFALLGNRLSGAFEWFQRDTKDILSQSVALSSVLGASAPMQNVGAMRTRGWEFNLNWRGHIGREVAYRVGFNIWDYMSKVTALKFNEEKNLDYLYVGKTVGEIWGYESDGFYSVDDFSDLATWALKDGVTTVSGVSPRPGDYKFRNLNDNQYGDGDTNNINSGKNTADEPGDRRVIGNTTPRFQYGLNLGLSVKGFDLSVMLQGVGKRDYFNSGPYFYTYSASDAMWHPVYTGTDNYWKPVSIEASSPDYYVAENPDATLPRIYGNVGNASHNRRTNTHMLSKASYLRVKNVTLSYSFPKKWMNSINVSNLRAYVSAENLFTYTSLPKGIDPETLSWSYPLYRTVSLGLNLTF